MRLVDTLAAAAEQLAQPGEEPIELPEPMEDLEGQLNAVRERALRDARAAREAEQRKNDLVVYLAHDLKTPLTSVIGYLYAAAGRTAALRRAAGRVYRHRPGEGGAAGGSHQRVL